MYQGRRGKHVRESRIRATDLPAIADALGISVDQLIDHAKKK